MNTKDKVEAYVREHCPELMELSFGCVIRDCKGGKVRLIGKSHRISEKTIKEIIGHPIQLQHWLEVLRKCGKAVCVRTDGIARPYMRHPGASDEMMEWGVDRHELRFNRDGQPATEADYQALAEILNIEV